MEGVRGGAGVERVRSLSVRVETTGPGSATGGVSMRLPMIMFCLGWMHEGRRRMRPLQLMRGLKKDSKRLDCSPGYKERIRSRQKDRKSNKISK